MAQTWEGSCLCGAVRYRIVAERLRAVHCHCRMCQRSGGGALMTWVLAPREGFAFTAGAPLDYASSVEGTRSFCGRCGSPLTCRHDSHPEVVDVSVGTLDDPDAAQPSRHWWSSRRVGWLRLDDGLPRHPEEDRNVVE